MARRKKHPEHVNHERWLVSYADFITLLFAFFVVMFAVSQVDSKKVGRFTESFSKAIGVDLFPQPGRGLLAGATDGIVAEPDPKKGSALPEELAHLQTALTLSSANDDLLKDVQIVAKRNELVVRLSDNLLFDSGNDVLKERPQHVVDRLAAELVERKVDVRVEGHTDDRPIKTARFRSNWDLSTARATAIVHRLAAGGLAPPRLSAAGYGEFHPVASNATEAGRKQNRRVDIVVTMPTPTELVDDPEGGTPDALGQQGAPAVSPAAHEANAAIPSLDAGSVHTTRAKPHDRH
jgi:chemotaxis protein MotB